MELILHPDAASNFDQKAGALIALLELRVDEAPSGPIDSNLHIDGSIPFSDITNFEESHHDLLGREDARFFHHGNHWVGFSGESYQSFAKLAKALQSTKALRQTVSQSLIRNTLFHWLKRRYLAQTSSSMTSFVLEQCGQEVIEDVEVWIPISNLIVESPFEIGSVVIKNIQKEMFDIWQSQIQADAKSDVERANIKTGIDRRRRRFQRLAAATISLTADMERAKEIAREYADQSISALRFFSLASLNPHVVSYTDLSGIQHEDKASYFVVDREGRIGYGSGFAGPSAHPWMLSIDEFSHIFSQGLNILSDLLKRKRSEFQQKTVNAVMRYSKAALSKDVSLKFVHILIALESVFLRDKDEPIGSNMKDRLAFLIGTSRTERKDIAQNLARAYELRAQFLHHGRPITISDADVVEPFVVFAWRSIAQLIQLAADNEMTTKRLFEELDDLKWSNPFDQ